MGLALQVLATGTAAGAVYGLVAIGYSLAYRLTGIVYFALGDLIGLAVFAALLVAAGTGPVTQTNVAPARFVVALLTGFVLCAVVSAAGYIVAVHPHIVRGSLIGWVGATLAIAYFVRSLVGVFFTRPTYVFPDPLPFRKIGEAGFVSVGGASIQVRGLFVAFVALVLAAVATQILARTKFGRGLEAIAADVEGAALVGVPVRRFVALGFGLAGGVAALAAVVAAPSAPFGLAAGAEIGVKGLAAAAVVGFASPWLAFAAGLGFGLAESGITSAEIGGVGLGPPYRDVIPLAVAILVIAARSWPRPARRR